MYTSLSISIYIYIYMYIYIYIYICVCVCFCVYICMYTYFINSSVGSNVVKDVHRMYHPEEEVTKVITFSSSGSEVACGVRLLKLCLQHIPKGPKYPNMECIWFLYQES